MNAIVLGAGGFIGSHLVKKLRNEGFWVRGVDLKYPEFSDTYADEFIIGDLRDKLFVNEVLDLPFDEVYQLAADMGGAGYIFTGDNDAVVMHNSAIINLNVVDRSREIKVKNIFFSSSACVYPEHIQLDSLNSGLVESAVYPAAPDSEYGWEKLFSERLYMNYKKNFGLNVHIARFHNVFGAEGTWTGGKEKVPAALCRKIAEADYNGEIEMWGDGLQTRSFLFIDECLKGVRILMDSDYSGPFNIGSDEMVSINELAMMVMKIANKKVKIRHIDGPQGVRGRKSDNTLIYEKLKWKPSKLLMDGLEKTYPWIEKQVEKTKK